MSTEKRPRGRPRTFDPRVAMGIIVDTFRERGYAATSLDDLSRATGLSRPSLYAAFGDKHAMYLSAIDAFRASTADKALAALERGTTVEKSLCDFYYAMLDFYFGGEEAASGCLVFGTAPSAAYEELVRDKLGDAIDDLDRVVLGRLRRLADKTDSKKVRAAAELAANTLIGLSTRVKAGAPKDALRAQARRSARVISEALE